MEAFKYPILTLSCFGLLIGACRLDNPPKPNPYTFSAPSVSEVQLIDEGNDNDAGDFRVSFKKAFDEDFLSEYQVVLAPYVDSILSRNILDLDPTSILIVPKGQLEYDTLLPENLKDINGNTIDESTRYRAWVRCVPDGKFVKEEGVIIPSNAVQLKVNNIFIHFIENHGVMVSGYGKKILIDALPNSVVGYSTPSTTVLNNIINGVEPYGEIDLFCITHGHADHFHAGRLSTFGLRNSASRILGPMQVLDQVILSNEIWTNVPRYSSLDTNLAGIDIEIFHFKHFEEIWPNTATVDNYAFLIKLGGYRILHLGDMEFSIENLQNFDFLTEKIDILMVPAFNEILKPENGQLIRERINPDNIIAMHLHDNTPLNNVFQTYSGAKVMSFSGQILSY